MPIPYPPIPPESHYQTILDATISAQSPYTLTVPQNPDDPLHPVYFPGQRMPGMMPTDEFPLYPPEEILRENVNNLLL